MSRAARTCVWRITDLLQKSAIRHTQVEAQIGSVRRKYRARTLSAEENRSVWPNLLALYPSYADYQKRTTREIPLVELAPI